jgi:hypothetical protein
VVKKRVVVPQVLRKDIMDYLKNWRKEGQSENKQANEGIKL